ncbi:MAG TPA: M50 family metallopeptidase [Solirubrobacteraceae bacterium]|nr:M50 family metallopeptidase [Solirubrobacteraceae bacterium]
MSYFLAFLGFALLILIHEAGHFVAAKAVGMRVERFSLFFGPMFVKRRRGETEYGIGVIPLGGYVKITGMSPLDEFETPEIAARAYINQPPWKRIVVIAAGPAVNLLVAFLLVWIVFMSTRTTVVTSQGAPALTGKIGEVVKGSPAATALRVGDRIVSIDGVSNPQAMPAEIRRQTCAAGARVNGCAASAALTVVVRRGDAVRTVKLRPRWSAQAKRMLLGVSFDEASVANGVAYSAGQSVAGLWRVTERTVSVIANIFHSSDRRQLHSVVGAGAIASEDISAGWVTGFEIFALISLSLGIINLFPLLPLDGGHIFWAVAERLRGQRISLKVMERTSFVGFAAILLLMVIGLSNDINTLVGNGFHAQ